VITAAQWVEARRIATEPNVAILSLAREAGRCKPDPEAFRGLAARLGHAPEEILYLDDDATYVAGARDAGLTAHTVRTADDVITGLAAIER
jgi:putative hydrolase of the HAD superfamily